MRTSIALLGVAVVGMVLASCAAQHASEAPVVATAFEPAVLPSHASVMIEPAAQELAYPQRPVVAMSDCDVSHPYYRDAKTLVVGPARRGEIQVCLRPCRPDLSDKATVTVVRPAHQCRYYLGDQPLDRRTHLVLAPGRHCLYVLVMGEMVPVAEIELAPNVDYLACLGDF
jgi:hypothetical protein